MRKIIKMVVWMSHSEKSEPSIIQKSLDQKEAITVTKWKEINIKKKWDMFKIRPILNTIYTKTLESICLITNPFRF